MIMEHNKTLENLLILVNEQVVEICTKKSFCDKCLPRIPQNILSRQNLCKLLSQPKKCSHFGLNVKEKRLHKKIRHYTMKIVNFNAILLHDNSKNEYNIVFYRSGLSFNANIANFYLSGVTYTSSERRKNARKNLKKMARERVPRTQRNVSFENYVRRTIEEYYFKYLDRKHNLISVHAIFSVNDASNTKVFLTRDIAKYSDIGKFLKMVDTFDPTLKWNATQKLEDCLENLGIPMNNVLVIAQINQAKKNLFIQWNGKLVRSMHRKNIRSPSTQLIDASLLNLRLDHIRFNGADSKHVQTFMNIIEELVEKNIQGKHPRKDLEKNLENSCKTFITYLNAFETNQMSDIKKMSLPQELHALVASSRQELKSEMIEERGDTGKIEMDCALIDEKFQGILSKIDMLQKRIRTHVKTSPSQYNDVMVPQNEVDNLSAKVKVKSLEEIEMDATPPQEPVRRDPFQKSKFYKPEVLRKDSKMLSDLAKIEAFLKGDFQTNKKRIEGILRCDRSEINSPKNHHKVKEPEPLEASTPDVVEIQGKSDNPEPEIIDTVPPIQVLKAVRVKKTVGVTKASGITKAPGVTKIPVIKAPVTKTPKVTKEPGVTETSGVTKAPVTKAPVTKTPKVTKEPGVTEAPPEHFPLKHFVNGSCENPKKASVVTTQFPNCSKIGKSGDMSTTQTNTSTIITIKKYTEMDEETKSEMSTDTVNSFMRKRALTTASAVQTDRHKKKRLVGKLTQTDVDVTKEKVATAMETQTDISIHKHAQIKFSGINMQLSKNVTITNVRKNVINVRNICEETNEAVKRLLERDAILDDDDSPNLKRSYSRDFLKGSQKAEILDQIKNTLENVIDRFKKSTMLINQATNFPDMSQNLKQIMAPTKLPVVEKDVILQEENEEEDTEPVSESSSISKEEKASNISMSLKLLKNLSEVTKTIRKNPREAARKLYGIRNELMHYRKNSMCNKKTSKVSSQLHFLKTSSTLTARKSKSREQRNSLFPKGVPLDVYGYPASNLDPTTKTNLKELDRIFTPKTRSICNTELSILKHRDRHADYIASHQNEKNPKDSSRSKYCLKTFRTKSAQMKSHRCQMYIAKAYKQSYASSLSATACAPSNLPKIETAIENPLVPKIVRPVRWKHPIPESPQLSNLSLRDVKPFNSEYPRKDYVTASTHSYLERLLGSHEHVPLIKCSENDCVKCSERSSLAEVSVCGKSPKETTDFIVNEGKAHFKTEIPKGTQPQVALQAASVAPSVKFDFAKFMLNPDDDGKNLNLPKVNYTVCPVNILQKKNPELPKTTPPVNKKLHEVKDSQNQIQKSINHAITQNQEKFHAMQRILALSKPQERKMSQPLASRNSSGPPKIKSTYTKKFTKNTNSASTSKSRCFFPTTKQSIQTAVVTYKTVKQVQPHPKLKQLQQQQVPLKPKLINTPVKPSVIEPSKAANFNRQYSEVSFSSLKTIAKEDKPPSTLTTTTNPKAVKSSQEDIQKYITLVEQKFLKTFSLNEQEKEGAYKNLVDEIQGMLNVLSSKDKLDKKTKIKKSLEKLTKETENVNITTTNEGEQQKNDTSTSVQISSVKKNSKTEGAEKTVKYMKTLESVGKSLKNFKTTCAENNKISEAAAEKLLSWKTKTTKTTKSTPEDPSKTSVASKLSVQYTLSEKERIIEEKLVDFPPGTETNDPISSQVVIKTPISQTTIEPQMNESNAIVIAKKKNSDLSQPTLLSASIISSDSLTETDDMINYSTSLSLNNSFKLKSTKNVRSHKSHSSQRTIKDMRKEKVMESPNSTDTSLVPISYDMTDNSYLTINEFSETGSSNSDIKIAPLLEFSIEMNLCNHLHYSYRCQTPMVTIIPHLYHKIHFTERRQARPITQAYKQKYGSSKTECYGKITGECPITSSLTFSSLISEDSVNIEEEFMKSYSDKLFSESINTILSKNSDLTLKNIFGSCRDSSRGSKSDEKLVRKTSSNFYEYIDLLSNISRIFIEPEVTQFYQPKFISYCSVPARETKTYYMMIIFCRVEFNYSVYNPSRCNLLDLSASSAQFNLTEAKPLSSVPLSYNTSSYLSISQNTVGEFSDVTTTQFSKTSVSTADLFSEPEKLSHDQSSLSSKIYYSVKSSITKFEYLNDNIEIQTITQPNVDKIDNVNILIQNVETPTANEPNVPSPEETLGTIEPNVESIEDEGKQPLEVKNPGAAVKKPSLEELYVEDVCYASKKSSTCFNIGSIDNSLSVEVNFVDDETDTDPAKSATEANQEIVEVVETVATAEAVGLKNDFKRFSNKLAQQSNELGQLLANNHYQHSRLPRLVSVKNRFFSQPFVGRFDGSYNCNYDLKLTISPKYLASNFSSTTGMQIIPLLKHRVGTMSRTLTMKIEMNQQHKGSRFSSRNISFSKPKSRSLIVYHKSVQNMQSVQGIQGIQGMQSRQNMQKSKLLGSSKFSLIQVQKKEMCEEPYKMVLVVLYILLFSFIFTCMTINYKCE